MIVFRTPKGWSGPKFVDGNLWRDLARASGSDCGFAEPEHLKQLEDWLKSYRAHELSTKPASSGTSLRRCADGHRRME